MEIIKKVKTKEDFYRLGTRLLSAFIDQDKRLTPTEEEIFIQLLCNPGPVLTPTRKMIMRKCKMSTQSLSAHTKRMQKKGWLNKYSTPDKALLSLIDNLTVSIKYEEVR
jgi:DNA-binding MarR family transcriptional regulator